MRIDFKNIFFQYMNTDMYILKGITGQISEPGFHGLFGPSGVGKTTLAKIIAGRITNFSGKITLQRINKIFYSYNMERVPGWSCIADHLEKITEDCRKSLLNDLIKSFGLEKCLKSRFAMLSLGQQNRVNLTRYLLQDFDILIMDESLANVDEITRKKIILKIKDLFPGKCFLYISHNLTEVARFCKQITVLRASHKNPQAVCVNGQNDTREQTSRNQELENTIMEVVHAS
jgi:ABC-type Mn2+/Zn2+ transport system ATPase subunit